MLGRGWAPLHGVVRDGKKYVDLPLPELYDLARDPREQANVVASAALERERLVATLGAFRAGDAGPRRAEEDAETRERLRALGYVADVAAPPRERYTETDDPKRLVHLDRLMEETLVRHREGDVEGALATAREVVRQRPDMTAALLQVALLERKAGRLAPAIEALERAIAVAPGDVSVAVLLGSYLGEAGRAREAAQLLEPYAAREDPPLDVLTARATALARLGRSREATAAFERARAADPGNPATLVQLATVHLAAGEYGRGPRPPRGGPPARPGSRARAPPARPPRAGARRAPRGGVPLPAGPGARSLLGRHAAQPRAAARGDRSPGGSPPAARGIPDARPGRDLRARGPLRPRLAHFHQGSLKGGVGRGVGFGAGGGPWSTWPSMAGVELGRLGPKTSHPRPAARTIAPATTSAFTSPGMVARTSRRLTGSRERAGRGGASAGEAAATSSARARVMPQWHASARRGTRRPQLGHVQVWGVSSAIIAHPRPTPGVRS